MYYRAELDFLRRTLKRMRVQTVLLHSSELPDEALDFGLRRFLGNDSEYQQALRDAAGWVHENTIYKLTDTYYCNYIFLVLPGTEGNTSLLIGPYLSFRMTRQQILETAEQLSIPTALVRQLEDYYTNIPIVGDDSALFVLLNAFAECLWGEGSAYEIVDLDQDTVTSSATPRPVLTDDAKGDTLLQMKIMETRYAYENELMETVSKGLVHRAERMLFHAAQGLLQQRIADPLRSLKNYCIICNTLMRKAAERGGVHPIYLDGVSSSFARKIESVPGTEAGQALMTEMVRTYCRLVRKHSTTQYSPLIQKVVAYIEADLSGDLSLRALAAVHSINPSYLSSLFRKETGKTVTEFVNEKRMEQGMQLLNGTRLQIQTIAQHCGMSDANYFSKLFKKQFGMTPKEFREAHAQQSPAGR